MPSGNQNCLRQLILAACALSATLASPAAAQSQQHYQIPVGPLDAALRQFSRQTDQEILFNAGLLAGKRTNGFSGEAAAAEVLQRLLARSGLTYVVSPSGALLVMAAPAGPEPRQGPSAPSQADSPPRVEDLPPIVRVVDEVVVTGSRIARAGFTAPTPVTVVMQEQLKAEPLVSDSLRQLPALQSTTSAATQRNGIAQGGKAQLNLRGLGVARTLVLLDGKRFITAGDTGAPDISQFPSSLVDRVEIVTGGASAAYGSDAVAGVVNFVLDKKFEGLKASLEGGVSGRGDNANWTANAAYGRAWGAGGRGHLLLSYEHSDRQGMLSRDRDFTAYGVGYATYPGQTPLRRKGVGLRHSDANAGGLVISGPLKGLTFGPGGAPRQFAYGTDVTSTTMVGGEGPITLLGLGMGLGAPLVRDVAFGRVSYDVTPDWNVFTELNWGFNDVRVHGGYNYVTGVTTAPLIQRDNAFLPPSVRAQMVALGLQGFRVNKILEDLPEFNPHPKTGTYRAVMGLEGKVGGWTTDAYYTYGVSNAHYSVEGMLNNITFYSAADAIFAPDGRIICRSTLTNPGDGCVPFNVLGPAENNPDAIRYVTGDAIFRQYVTQSAGGVSLNGEPFILPAGPVSLAVGAEFRRETLETTSDAISNYFNPYTNSLGGWRSGNQPNVGGSTSVIEAFAETVIPVLKDIPMARSLEINAAARVTDYKLSGTVETWKFGATYQPVDDVRFRLTRSRDIRAPTLGELYNFGGGGQIVLADTSRGNVAATGVRQYSQGNTGLRPEIADTLTYGIVLQPRFVPGLSVSVDRFDIDIADAIANLGAQGTVDECARGATDVCRFVQRDPVTQNLTLVYSVPYNFAVRRVKGYDLEGSYRLSLDRVWRGFGDGQVIFRALATYLGADIAAVPGAAQINRAGQLATLKWRANASAHYALGDWSGRLNLRYIDGAVQDVTWKEGIDIDDNTVPSTVYLDLRVARSLNLRGGRLEIVGTVNNLLDKQPVLVGTDASQSSPFSTTTDYDLVGRAFRLAVNFQF